MVYVYLIQSIPFPHIVYVGYTANFEKRLEKHNEGGSIYTSTRRPWKLKVVIGFEEIDRAKEFEKYLKSQSGRAFAKKRLW